MAEYYAGIDLGARSSWLCVVDAKGVKRFSRRLANEAFVAAFFTAAPSFPG